MASAQRILWLGGPPGSGKTTVARSLARRYGLRWYNADTRTWRHRDRALRAGHPEAIRFELLPPSERTELPAADQLAMSLHHERGEMIVDDVLALPDSPLIIAEGTPVTPSMLPPGSQALWLLPSDDEQRARLEQRHGPDHTPPLYRHLWQVIDQEVQEHQGYTLVPDTHTVAETIAEVARIFAAPLANGPRADNAEWRRELLRSSNRAIVGQYRDFFARPWANRDPASAVLTLDCECGDRECAAMVDRALLGFDDSAPVLADEHGA